MQVAVLDRFVWSSLPLQTTDIHRHASITNPCAIPEHALSLISSCQKWQETIATAAANFLVHEKEIESPQPNPSNCQQADGAVESLGLRLAVSKNDTLVNHVEQNLVSAAIALRALAEVSYSLLVFVENIDSSFTSSSQRLLALEDDIVANRIGAFGDRRFGSGNAASVRKLYDILSQRYHAQPVIFLTLFSLFSPPERIGRKP